MPTQKSKSTVCLSNNQNFDLNFIDEQRDQEAESSEPYYRKLNKFKSLIIKIRPSKTSNPSQDIKFRQSQVLQEVGTASKAIQYRKRIRSEKSNLESINKLKSKQPSSLPRLRCQSNARLHFMYANNQEQKKVRKYQIQNSQKLIEQKLKTEESCLGPSRKPNYKQNTQGQNKVEDAGTDKRPNFFIRTKKYGSWF